MIPTVEALLKSFRLPESQATTIAPWVAVVFVVIIALFTSLVIRKILLSGIRKAVTKSKFKWDDTLLERNVFKGISHIIPALVVYLLMEPVFGKESNVAPLVMKFTTIYMWLVGTLIIDSILNATGDFAMQSKSSKHFPIRGFLQVLKLLLYIFCALSVIALVLDKKPLAILASIGAFMAIIMLVFKDPILGLVAGIQLTSNKMLARGDWIEMPKYNADGDVEEIALTTVKVRNFDKTITTIPTYAFISDSFKNWRGMTESGGRRIKRSVNIDLGTIKFCDEEMLKRFSNIQFISEYIEGKVGEVHKHNHVNKVDLSIFANGRRLTNVGTFRAYIEAYLRNHLLINKDLTLLVRQLKATSLGLPIEIYVFCSDKRWVQYEGIMADIFDHIFAVVSEFDLKLYQEPSGHDIKPRGSSENS